MGRSEQVQNGTSVALRVLLDEVFAVVWGGHELEGDPGGSLVQRGYWMVCTPLPSPEKEDILCACTNCLLILNLCIWKLGVFCMTFSLHDIQVLSLLIKIYVHTVLYHTFIYICIQQSLHKINLT